MATDPLSVAQLDESTHQVSDIPQQRVDHFIELSNAIWELAALSNEDSLQSTWIWGGEEQATR